MAFIDEPIGNSGNGKIMRTCPYNKQMVDVSDCWRCKHMTIEGGCILTK